MCRTILRRCFRDERMSFWCAKKDNRHCPTLYTYIHCNTHRLNLVILVCVRNIGRVSSFFDLLQRIYVFMSGSAVHKFFSKKLKESNKELGGAEGEMFKSTLKRLSVHCGLVSMRRVRLYTYL